jgi:choline dehydrogenase-like flavoprotein
MPTPNEYDVLIIGSGASGGMAAHTLTKLGVKCLLLDAGPLIDPDKQRVLRPVSSLPYRGFGKPGRFPHVTQADEFNGNMWADEKLNPYTYDASSPYYWVRIRLVGGKTLAWGRASWRLSDYEFKCRDHDGFGENWPIQYSDLAPFYGRVEPLFKVSGRKEGFAQIPDGVFLPDESRDSQCVQRFLAACKKHNVPTTKQRRSTGTLASSLNLLLPAAIETGNLTLVPNAIVRQLSFDKSTNRVTGAHFVDRISKREFHAKAKAVIVGASALESVRLLLNSKLANSSGQLGHHLFDQFYVKSVVQASVPEARNGKGGRTLMGGGGYIPRFRNLDKNKPSKNFIRGYAYDFGSGFSFGPQAFSEYGEALWKKLDEYQGSGFSLTTMGEVLPRYENFARINPIRSDAWGIPVLHIQHKYTDNEFNMAKDSMNIAAELCRDAGFDIVNQHWEMVPPGESIHELGGCRMSADPKKGILNAFNQSHDHKNLYVVDGSSFVSGGAQNPTLTILALSLRASEHLVAESKKGNL